MKRRRLKAKLSRRFRKALRRSKRELGDHRRYWWMATMPYTYFHPLFQCEVRYLFDPKYGRLYEFLQHPKGVREETTSPLQLPLVENEPT